MKRKTINMNSELLNEMLTLRNGGKMSNFEIADQLIINHKWNLKRDTVYNVVRKTIGRQPVKVIGRHNASPTDVRNQHDRIKDVNDGNLPPYMVSIFDKFTPNQKRYLAEEVFPRVYAEAATSFAGVIQNMMNNIKF